MAYGASGGFGLQPLNSGNGVTFSGITNQYNLPATGGQTIFQGDPVALSLFVASPVQQLLVFSKVANIKTLQVSGNLSTTSAAQRLSFRVTSR